MFDAGRFYRASEVWRLSGAPRDLVYAALRAGKLRAWRRGNRWLIPGRAAIEWLEGGDAMTDNDPGRNKAPAR